MNEKFKHIADRAQDILGLELEAPVVEPNFVTVDEVTQNYSEIRIKLSNGEVHEIKLRVVNGHSTESYAYVVDAIADMLKGFKFLER